MRNVYIIVQNGVGNANLTLARTKGRQDGLSHQKAHSSSKGANSIFNGEYSEEDIAWFEEQSWAYVVGEYLPIGRAEQKVYTHGWTFTKPTWATVTPSPYLVHKSISTMKLSRDTSNLSSANKILHIDSLVNNIQGLTHIDICCFQNDRTYHSLAWIKDWFSLTHARNLKVLFRPGLGSGGWSNAAQLTQLCVNTVNELADVWQDGDLCDIIPESNPMGGPYNTYYGLGNPASWNQFVRDTTAALKSAFQTMGKDVQILWSQTDQTFVFNLRVEAATLAAMDNILCLDYYPMDAGTDEEAVNNFIAQLGRVKSQYPAATIYITETGYNNQILVSEQQQRNRLALLYSRLSTISYVELLNYWCAYGNEGSPVFDKTNIFKSNSLTQPKLAVAELEKLYNYSP